MSHHHQHHNGNGKLTPNLDEKSTKMLNLTVLQRIDPFIEEILITSAHVTLYEFNGDATQWSRKDVEGSLFVVKRSVQPRFQFIVMNRRSTDNLVEDLLGDFEYEVQVPYLLYRNASQEVNGIWFYTARECEEIAAVFGRILNAYSRVATKPKVSSTKSEFEELEAVPTPAVIDGPLEPALSTNSNATDLPDDSSFLNFFTTTINVGGAPKSVISAQAYQSSAAVFSTSQSHSAAMPNLTAAQTQFALTSPAPFMSIRHNDTNATMKRSTNLVKPSSFFGPPPSSSPLIVPPISSSMPIAPPLGAPESLRSPYGAPLLQPFPPPTPPPSLTPTSVPSPNYGSVINREKVQEALRTLVQDNQFIDMVYRALMHAHQ